MNVRSNPLAIAVVPAFALLAACASQSPDPSTSSLTGVSAEPLGASAATTPSLALIRAGGSFLFSLDESDPSAMWHQRCGQESGGDAAKAEACYAHVREVGSHEGMRFALDADQRVIWTSFGLEDGKDAIYLQGPIDLRADADGAVVGTFAAPPHGLQMEGKDAWPKRPIRFELPDANTLVMKDEVKGRLVFHRTQP
jgi:hypothetical protein